MFVTLKGTVHGLDVGTGSALWTYDSKYTITTSPCIESNRVYVANHHGDVVALDALTGAVLWSQRVGAPVDGDIAADAAAVYVPAENMVMYTLGSSTDSKITAQHRVMGQTFQDQPGRVQREVVGHVAQGPSRGSEGQFKRCSARSPASHRKSR